MEQRKRTGGKAERLKEIRAEWMARVHQKDKGLAKTDQEILTKMREDPDLKSEDHAK